MKKESRPYHSTTKTSLTNSFFKGLLLLALLLFGKGYSTILWAQTGYFIQGEQEQGDVELINRGETFRGFKLHPVTGMPYESDVDTIALDYYKRTTVEGKGLAVGYNGNLIGPRHFKTYFDRTYPINPFIFGDTYQGLLYAQPSIRFYDTRSPYTNMLYQRNGSANQREEELDMTMALNIGKPISLGGDFNYTLSRGQYIGNLSQGVSYRLFGSLSLPRYELYASAGNNYLRMNENGGIKNDDYINNPMGLGGGRSNLQSIEIPVRFPSGVGNTFFVGHILAAHRFNIGSERSFRKDSRLPNGKIAQQDTTLFVPVGSISHRFSYDRGVRLYIGKHSHLDTIYKRAYPYLWEGRSSRQTDTLMVLPFDSIRMTQITNTVALSLREGFRPWMKFGLTAYARLENRSFFQRDTLSSNRNIHEFSTFVGGRIERKTGKGLNFDAGGEIAVLGSNIGALHIDGTVQTAFQIGSIPVGIGAHGALHIDRPPYLMRHHHGSFFRWDQEFAYTRRLLLGGTLSAPKWGTDISLHSATIGNQIYIAPDGFPRQYTQPLQIMEGRLRHQYHWGFIGWQMEGSYQISSNQQVMPLPQLSAYASLYLHFYVAKVMRTQIGADCYYHTLYHAPYYEPATQQFVNQRDVLVGNYPMLNFFANFKVRRVRFFLMMHNATELFLQPAKRFSLAHYPINPMTLRLGINFDFNN